MNQSEQINILLVDDDDIDIMSFKRALKKASIPYTMTTCTYAKETMDLLREGKTSFDCIFLDYQLPGTDGLQLLQEINSFGINIPISIMTSHGDEKLAVNMMKAGAFDYFPKSDITSDTLIKKIVSIQHFNEINSEKNKIELDLKNHKEFLQRITNSSPNIIYILDISTVKFSYYNRDILIDLGYTKNEIKQMAYPIFTKLFYKDDQERLKTHFEKLKKGENNKIYEFEYRIKDSNGNWVWYLNRDSIYKRHKNGLAYEILGTATNIDKFKKAEEESKKAKIIAERALEIKAEFLSNMSHEIRTPMNAIIGLTDIILRENLSNTAEENLKSIKQSSDNLLVIINDILDFSKIEAGKVNIEEIGFNFNYQLEHIEKSMLFKAQQKHLDFQVIIDKNIPPYLVGDPFRLNQILLNLSSNSIKFTQSGHVKIIAKLIRKKNDKILLRIDIEDTGIGISKEKQDHIFGSFTQADVNITRQFGGTGLGLAISKQLVNLMKGDISVKSKLGVGSTFTIELPFTISKEKITNNEELKLSEKELNGLRVLVMEDNLINQKVIIQILEQWGCTLEIANNGEEGIEMLSKDLFHIVLMDLQMPIMDGFEATKAIRSGKAGISNITAPIIALTADAFPETREKVMVNGMNDFVTKPFKRAILNNKIYKLVNLCCPEAIIID